jgi:uncharacterized protein DUF3301
VAEILALLLLGAAVAAWMDALRAREAALDAGRTACERYGVQFLDDTVAFARLRLARDENGRLGLERQYSFEFSEDGSNRRSGAIRVHGRHAEDVQLEAYPVH